MGARSIRKLAARSESSYMSQAPNLHLVMRLLILLFSFHNRLPNMQLFANALVSLTQKFSTGVGVIHMDSVSV